MKSFIENLIFILEAIGFICTTTVFIILITIYLANRLSWSIDNPWPETITDFGIEICIVTTIIMIQIKIWDEIFNYTDKFFERRRRR